MKKIAVVAVIGNPNSGSTRGVFDKVSAQVNALTASGYTAKGFLGIAAPHKIPPGPADITGVPFTSPYGKLFRRAAFFSGVLKQLAAFDPEILYLRYPLSDPALFAFLKRLRRAHPKIVVLTERQTKEIPELLTRKSLSNLAKSGAEWLFRKPVQRLVNINVGVTQEICDYIHSYAPAARCIPCGNGIPSDILDKPRPALERDGNSIRLVFVGNITLWSGLEFVIGHLYQRQFKHNGKTVHLDVIGDGVFLEQLKLQFPDTGGNVIYHGFLSGDALWEKITAADLALGALNNKKRLLTEGSNLKLRLYAAFGVPFVLSEYDTDFSASEEARRFYLDVSGKDGVDADCIDEMLDFATTHAGRETLSAEMRDFTRKTLTWEVKMQKILAAAA